jgi:putative ABC transport system permease protein
MWLLGIFTALALLLASIGGHGVVANATVQRTREIGIRMALGARHWQLFALVTRQAVRLAIADVAIGVAAAYAATRLLQSLLFGVVPHRFRDIYQCRLAPSDRRCAIGS